MTVNRNESCTCGSGKKYKKCCMNWRENWALAIDGFACDDQIKKIIRGSFNFIVEHDYQGGCHLISAIIHILLTEKGYDSVVRIGEVKINNFVFDHSWVEIEGKL